MEVHTLDEKAKKQLKQLKSGVPKVVLSKAATPGDGILTLNNEEQSLCASVYEAQAPNKSIVKFVPASGAATRMFKDLALYLETHLENEGVKVFTEKLEQFPFFHELNRVYREKNEVEINRNTPIRDIVKCLLAKDGLNYGSMPKALIDFHVYEDITRKAVDEQVLESALYAAGADGVCRLHFTVSTSHEELVKKRLNEFVPHIEKRFDVKIKTEFSFQCPSTNTIAATLTGEPATDDKNGLIYRAGGHGSLLGNLGSLDADIIFIKNIDNVLPEWRIEDTVKWKKILAGKLLDVQKQRNTLLLRLDSGEANLQQEVLRFFRDISGSDQYKVANKADLKSLLNKPIRVCGMVKNTGAPGGGPFWVEGEAGRESLQIVEKAEVDTDDEKQSEILKNATHFNPVDIVCAIHDHKGEKYKLEDFKDESRVFISEKTFEGKPIKALEHPGLWNGSMSNWLTVFVEVPVTTFNPVKTVFDLLNEVRKPSK